MAENQIILTNYAQLDFTENHVKRVNLIGGPEVGIIPALVERFPDEFVLLDGREDIPADCFDWWYIPADDRFVVTADIPHDEPEAPEVVNPEEGGSE